MNSLNFKDMHTEALKLHKQALEGFSKKSKFKLFTKKIAIKTKFPKPFINQSLLGKMMLIKNRTIKTKSSQVKKPSQSARKLKIFMRKIAKRG